MSAGSRSTSWTTLRGAVVWDGLQSVLDRLAADGRSLSVVDAGGGTGGFAVPLAQRGHHVTVIDPSFDSLASLDRRAGERGVADRVEGRQGDLSTLSDLVVPGTADLVLCHSVLEVVDDPAAALAAVAATLRPGGVVSLLVANRTAVVLARAVAGRIDDALAVLADPAGRGGHADPLARRFDREGLSRLVERAGLSVEAVHGVRVTLDLVPGSLLDADADAYDALLRLEREVSQLPALRDVATQFHLLASRP